DRKTGLIAAAILAVLPLEIFLWSPLLVDAVTPFYWGASLGLFYLGLADDPPARRPSLLLFATGFLLGLASYTREHAPIVFLVMAAYLVVRRRRPPRRLWWLGAGFVALVALGESYYFAVSGVPFLRIHRLWEHFGPGSAGAAEPGSIEIGHFQGLRPWFLQSMLSAPDYFGFLFWIAWVAAFVVLWRRQKNDAFPLTWFFGLYVAMDLVLRTFVRLLAYPPYINVLDLPAALLSARLVAPHLAAKRRWVPAVVALGFVLALGGAVVLGLHHTLTSSVEAWGANLGGWGRAHAHDARFATVPIFAGSVLLAFGFYLASARWQLGWGSAVLVFLIVSPLFLVSPGVRWRRAAAAPLRDRAAIVGRDARPVYMTSLWPAPGLNFFLDYRSNFRRYWNRWESVTPGDPRAIEFRELPESTSALAPHSYVVLDKGPI